MEASKPAISVVIPLHNKGATIAVCLESVVQQTFGDFEVVVVDDGSTDRGADVARSFVDSRIRVVSQANSGASAARNRGIAEARAELVALLDADDEWQPNHLAALFALAAQFPQAGLYTTGVRRRDSRGPYKEVFATLPGETGLIEGYFAAPEEGTVLAPSSAAVRKSVVAAVGGFLEGEPMGEDLEMWARIALRYPVACARVVSMTYETDDGERERLRLRIKSPYPPQVRTVRAAVANGSFDPRKAAVLKHYADWHAMAFLRWLLELKEPIAGERLRNERFDTFRFRVEGGFLRVVSRILSPRAAWEVRYRPGQIWRRICKKLFGQRMTKTGRIVSWRLLRKD